MARQWKLHTALILQGKIDVPRNVRQFRAVKASGYLVLPTFVNCDLDRVFPFRIGGNVPVKVESWKVKILEIGMQFKNNPWTKELNYVKNPSHFNNFRYEPRGRKSSVIGKVNHTCFKITKTCVPSCYITIHYIELYHFHYI